ncbi:otoferlin-like isoform X3 [Harmonia axyridis]|uniref:otoferlin-like isoform X3 n=1 Tax=Harmonia axyridis TaxID=115357 RepID=UPI001E275FDC|nr:otoferlin-like isoform X3 [Harmonia axyridis]
MSLSVKIKQFQIPKCKGEKLARIEFRGVSHIIRLEDTGSELYIVDQTYDWPVCRPVEESETLQIDLFSRNRVFSDKHIGSYALFLQGAIKDGRLTISDTLLDPNNQSLPVLLEFEVLYVVPEDSLPSFAPSNFENLDDDQHMLIDIERNIKNYERSISVSTTQEKTSTSRRIPIRRSTTTASSGKTSSMDRKRTSPLRNVRNLIRFGKQRPPKDDSENVDETTSLIYTEEFDKNTTAVGSGPWESESAPVSRAGSQSSLGSQDEDILIDAEGEKRVARISVENRRLKTDLRSSAQLALKAQDFQVCLTIIEARQLAGLNMDPVVCIQIGDQKKYTSVKESTNCPYYNEYFVFDFHMPPIMLFDKIIVLSVLRHKMFPRSDKLIGNFKLDVGTVWSQPDHQFFHKWALLTDPDDITGGPKGYLKCDISVIGKGDPVKVPAKSEKDEDDIEANLLLPDGVPINRQKARLIIKIYKADGLPKMNSSLMANVKKAFTGESQDLVNPFVQVSFAGLQGKTSVKKHSYAPVWNEQIVFTEMFPPLCQRIKIQLRDDDPIKPQVIGTHFIDLKTISNDGEKGFLPTFGPSFVHLYGSTRDYTLIDRHSNLNTGFGEGVSYRARLLMAIRTEISDSIMDLAPSAVEVEHTNPVNEESYAKNDEYFLFTTIMGASMIDKKFGDKPVYLELSMGNAGNAIDGQNTSVKEHYDSDSDELESVSTDSGSWLSTTPPSKPMTHDKVYYFLPYWDNKPCMHIRSVWPDLRRRMYNSNIIAKIAEKMEDGLQDVTSLHEADSPLSESRLKQVLEELHQGCGKYVTITQTSLTGPGTGKTKLDKEHVKLCLREIELMGSSARNLRALVTKSSFKERFKVAQSYLAKLKFLVEDPQHALPDVFLWLISGGKRQAYQRIPARDIIYSVVEEERGKDCGKVRTMFLKIPSRKGAKQSGWTIPCKLRIFLWLGTLKHKKYFINGIPKGYEETQEFKNVERPRAMPPSTIHYVEKHTFQLRAHIYQARSLIGSDSSGLSDPFATVIASEFSKTTQVIDETLSPTWDELLVFEEILLYGSAEEIKHDPISIIIEIFDQDNVGKSEFIGRALAKPKVKLRGENYAKPKFPPMLEWFEIHRGADKAGELLAAFELLEIPKDQDADLPPLPAPKEIPMFKDTDLRTFTAPILPVPRGIRPTLARYRIEVLFWGLRDLKRVHMLSVDRPRVDVECAGQILSSTIIQNAKKNPNFTNPVKFFEIDLPEQELYRPPLTIRCVDCRSWGLFTLVGTHTINSIHKYMYIPPSAKDADASTNTPQKMLVVDDWSVGFHGPNQSPGNNNTNIKTPLLPKDNTGGGYGTQEHLMMFVPDLSSIVRKRKISVAVEEEDDDEDENKDWWTKYYASVEQMCDESKEEQMRVFKGNNLDIPNQNENSTSPSTISEKSPSTGESRKKFNFKTAVNASRFTTRISPKGPRKINVEDKKKKSTTFKIYKNELEQQAEYNQFKDWLMTFPLYRGKKTEDDAEDDSRIVGYFKGAIKVYKWPLPADSLETRDLTNGYFQGLPSNEPIRVLVRVYIVKANDLHPQDLNGKADPYVVLQLGSKRISDKENYVSKTLNPVFGKCFEIEATFPQDSMLTVQIYDWDLLGSDDLVGETRIDLENRFYSKHRATCGFPAKYEETGHNAWRDPMKPTQILAKLCKDNKIDPPVYGKGQVKVCKQVFTLRTEDYDNGCGKNVDEQLALNILNKYHHLAEIGCPLVPEHVETRPLYNPEKPGIEQGKLEMWVDMFPKDMPLPAAPVEIAPRKPCSYELRVVIWNTDEVVLEDDAFFTGEKMSDIYVKGWLKGPEDCQSTDIHYRSLTGEGNFNWRFIFPFDYLEAEQKIVITKKESMFSWDETESKIPARLELQVWDADHFSADDFLGNITLDLNKFPRGAKSAKLCTLDILKNDGSVPMVNIFKQKRIKGWWPFFVKKDDNDEMELTGKVEAEFHLVTAEEAEKAPVGAARNEPEPLDKPNRPDASFVWFMNPLKSMKYVLWHNYKWKILKFLIIAGVAIMILLFFYAIPGYSVKRIMGA